jgi:hypothetical protein
VAFFLLLGPGAIIEIPQEEKGLTMSQVEMLEQIVKRLGPGELAAFRSWFVEFDAAEWDRQLEAVSESGKLDRLAQPALPLHRP